MSSRIHYLRYLAVLATLAVATCASGQDQTYKVNSRSAEQPQTQKSRPQAQSPEKRSEPQSHEKVLGWGSNIQNARLARAAETALRSHNYPAAVDYAQRAAQSAPNDAQLWFLLGYAARLAAKSQLSVDAYNLGLRANPSSLEGLSGLAQTYSAMGRKNEAQTLLNRVLASDPKRTGDLLLLGEIFLQTGQYDQALAPLERAERLQPGARSELLLALAYQRMKQFNDAKRYLETAKRRAPNNPEVLQSLAGFYRETGSYSAAISALRGIRNSSPDLKAELAYTYQLSGKPEEAAKLYAEAADAASQDLNLQLSAAQAQLGAGVIEAAKVFLKRASGLDAEHYRLHAIRGEVARLEERNQDAVREHNVALSNLPQAPPEGVLYPVQLHMNLMELYQRLHDEGAAKSQLGIAQSQISSLDVRGRSREDFLRLRAMIKLAGGDTEGALKDVNEALTLNAKDPNALQLNGDVLAKMGRGEDAIRVYKKILAIDPVHRLALTSLGSVSRELGHDRDAEKYFQRLAAAYPRLYVPHLALGDMYTSRRDFAKAEAEYRKAYEFAPTNSLVIAGGMNAGIEAKQFPLAAQWLSRATPEMQQDPQVMREKERYLTWTEKYQESAEVGQEAIKKLPRDRDVVVYLGYDLLHLERYDELLQLTSKYEEIMPKEPTLPLLAGYVHKHNRELDQAQAAFTCSLERDPKVATAYVNRGFVLHDLRKGAPAAADFEAALRLEPKNGEAHLGLAYASLDLHRPQAALQHAKLAQKELGESMALHLIRGTAYGDEGMLKQSAVEYRIALKSAPNDAGLHLALANTLYDLHEYRESVDELQASGKLSPNNGAVYAQLARAYAQLVDRGRSMQYVQLAEKQGPSTIYLSTGEALSLLGEQDAALERFERALTAPESDRISVRLAVARLMMKKDETDDARRQIALALMESAKGRTPPATGNQLMQAADLFLGMHEYQLAETYFQRALAAGASETSVRLGLANTYLALGDTPRAEGQINSISRNLTDSEPSYQYLLTRANVFRQQHQNARALTAFAQAAESAGEDPTAERELLRAGGDEGIRINHTVSLHSDFSVAPIFENTTVYALDAQLVGAPQGFLPTPRSSLETQWTAGYHLHLPGLPDAGGFFQIRNARGEISLPSANTIIDRNTTDYSFNFAVNPTFRLGNNVFTFSAGLQKTLRRDSADPFHMNQNLFRQFAYMSTSSFFNWVSAKGYAIREAGPFTESNLRSRNLAGALEFRVGRPWGKTAFVTGWGARDEQFFPVIREFYYTSTYGGIEQQFSENFRLRAVGEYLRSWRVEGQQFAIAQAFRPAANIEYSIGRKWSVEASVAYSRNMGLHVYDAVESGFSISYAMPVRRVFEEGGQALPLRYPIRFSAGLQQESFFNFTGGKNQQFQPFIRISLF
ncbi:MAG: tetratricopeptide repeat protein [Terriglobales bacterium]